MCIEKQDRSEKFRRILAAASVAIAVNTLMLKSAPLFGINVGAGGLFGLLNIYFGDAFSRWGLSALWSTSILPQPGSLMFYILFHSLIGFVMAALYVYVFEERLSGSGIRKGAVFSLLPWLINSIVVLPLLGKGFAGSNVLDTAGLIYFFVANGTYGVLLGYLYERLSFKH